MTLGIPSGVLSTLQAIERLCGYRHRGDDLLCLNCESDEHPAKADENKLEGSNA
jgi:hypothetical protein